MEKKRKAHDILLILILSVFKKKKKDIWTFKSKIINPLTVHSNTEGDAMSVVVSLKHSSYKTEQFGENAYLARWNCFLCQHTGGCWQGHADSSCLFQVW